MMRARFFTLEGYTRFIDRLAETPDEAIGVIRNDYHLVIDLPEPVSQRAWLIAEDNGGVWGPASGALSFAQFPGVDKRRLINQWAGFASQPRYMDGSDVEEANCRHGDAVHSRGR